jgi:lysine 2,3-aminomutase
VNEVAYLPSNRGKLFSNVAQSDFGNHFWQDKNSVVRFQQLESLLKDEISPAALQEMSAGLGKVGMSIRLNPYVLSLIDWSNVESDPIRRQFLPMRFELEDDHPCLAFDSLEERETSPVSGLVHRYPDKVLFLVTSVCPVYCQYCTRSYAVGQDTALAKKDNVTSAQNWAAAFDYIRANPQIEDVVVSGGDVSRLKPANIRLLVNTLLDIPHIRRIRLATKAVSVLPQKFLTDDEWFAAIVEVVQRGRSMFKDVCVHTHFNHPREVTPTVEQAMRRLHGEGIYVRNQAVLLRGVNDDAKTLIDLVKALGRVNIHPYYVYLCDMVTSTEHFRLPLATAQRLEKEVRGATAGFNTPLFVCDAPGGGGKRDVHSAEFYDDKYGVSGFRSPSVDPNRIYYYFDPLRALDQDAREAWRAPGARDHMLSKLGFQPATAEAAE